MIGLIRRDPRTMAAVSGRRHAITFITVAELYLGVLKADDQDLAMEQLERVWPEEKTFYPSEMTPMVYAGICRDLERRGLRIPSNDLWIAALAMEYHLPLLGRDEHFSRVEGLDFIPC